MAEYRDDDRPYRQPSEGLSLNGSAAATSRGLAWLAAAVRRNPWFAAIVVLPSLVAGLYYGLIASDIYVSEARYIVRSVNGTRNSIFGTMLQGTGLGPSQNDAYAVQNFIQSRDITRRLEAEHDLRGVLSRPEGDFVSRFPPPFAGRSFEQLHRVYTNFVSVTVDDTTGISTLRVNAYRPADAQNTAVSILAYSEDLINRLNDRARHDAIDVAAKEVARCEERVAAAQQALMLYRLSHKTLDPERASGAVLDQAARLAAEASVAEAQLAEVAKSSPNSPMVPSLRRRIAALNSQVTAERLKVVGDSNGVVKSLAEYERLLLEREFAGKNLLSSVASLEQARLEAQRKQIYLDRIVAPNLPDYPLYPKRLASILEIVLSTLLIYGIGWLVSASVREHVGR